MHSLSRLRHENIEGVQELLGCDSIEDYWSDQPLTDHLQIIVEIHEKVDLGTFFYFPLFAHPP